MWSQNGIESDNGREELDLEPIPNNGIDKATDPIWPTPAPDVSNKPPPPTFRPQLYPNVVYADHDDPRFNFGQRKGCITVRPFYIKYENTNSN